MTQIDPSQHHELQAGARTALRGAPTNLTPELLMALRAGLQALPVGPTDDLMVTQRGPSQRS